MSLPELIGETMFLSLVQLTLLGNESTSLYVASTSIKSQKDLDKFAGSIKHYFYIGIVWTIATSLLMFAKASVKGVLLVIFFNGLTMLYIFLRYRSVITSISNEKNLSPPNI